MSAQLPAWGIEPRNKPRLLMPTTLGGQPLKKIGPTTFDYSNVSTVVVPEGVETIE